jgi:hypothetical protein
MSLLVCGGHSDAIILDVSQVDTTAPKGDKSKKWLHALKMTAINDVSASKLYEVPKGSTENPYTSFEQITVSSFGSKSRPLPSIPAECDSKS